MSISSGAVAWDALEEIHRDVENYLQTVDLSELRRAGSTTAQDAGNTEVITNLRREVERLKKQLDEKSLTSSSSWINEPETRKRLRSLEEDPEDRPVDLGANRLKQELEEEKLMRVRDRERLEAKVTELQGETEKMVRKIRFLTEEDKNAQEKMKEAAARHLAEKASLQEEVLAKNRKIQSLEGELNELKRELMDLRRRSGQHDRHQQEAQRREDLITKLEADVTRLTKEVSGKDRIEAEVLSLRRRVEEETRRRTLLESQQANSQTGEKDYVSRLQEKVVELERGLKRQMSEVEKLKAERDNAVLQQEKIRDLEAANVKLQKEMESLVETGVKYETLMNEKQLWDKQFEVLLKESGMEGGGEATTTKVTKVIRKAQDEVARLWTLQSEVEAKCASLTRELAESKKQASEDGRRIAELEDQVTQLNTTLQDNTAYITVIKNENKAYRELLDSYDKDAPGPIRTTEGQEPPAEPSASHCPPHMVTRIKELERLLEEAQEELMVVKERSQTYASPDVHSKAKARVSALEKDVARLEQEKAQLNRRLESVEAELAIYETAAAKGAFNPDTTRVLHMAENPTTMAYQEEIRRLRAENQALRGAGDTTLLGSPKEGRSSLGGGGGASSSSIGPGESLDLSTTGPGQPGGGDVRVYYQRLKQMFRDKISFYRDMVYQLTGFFITLKFETKDPQVQLKSMYMEFETDTLLFEWVDEKLNLLETAFVKRLDQRLLINLRQWNSFPAFLAAVQMDLFEKQTFQG